MGRSNQPPKPECCLQPGQEPESRGMTAPNDLREAYTGQKRGPQAGFGSCLSNSASKCLAADGDRLGMPEPNTDRAIAGEALEGLPGSQSVARAAEAARNQGDPAGSRRTNYEGQAGRGVQRQEERPEARQGVGFVHSSPWQDASLEAGEGANRLTKHAQATRCRKNDGSTLANLPAGDTQRVSLRSPVREYCTPGSVRGAPGNRCPYLDIRQTEAVHLPSGLLAALPQRGDEQTSVVVVAKNHFSLVSAIHHALDRSRVLVER